jgi:hypothetical protein
VGEAERRRQREKGRERERKREMEREIRSLLLSSATIGLFLLCSLCAI